MSLKSVQIQNFKSIVDQTIDLGRVNCFIGANGVGKSNLLEAIGILGAAASGRVDDEAILRRGVRPGVPRLYKTSFSDQRIPLAINLEATSNDNAKYKVSLHNILDKPRPAWEYKSEGLHQDNDQLVSRGPNSKKQINLDVTSGLAALKVVELPPETAASTLIRALQEYAIFSPNTPTLRSIVPDPQPRIPVGLSGGGLAEGFKALTSTIEPDVIDSVVELIDWVAEIESSDASVAILSGSVPRTKNVLRFKDRFMAADRSTLTGYDASEGALYILYSAILCMAPASPSVFAIENLDSALNPRLATRLVQRLCNWLRDSSPTRQLLFTTHNPAVLDGLDLSDDAIRLFAVERNSSGHTVVNRIIPSSQLNSLRATYPLSRLWAMGSLGAVPNV